MDDWTPAAASAPSPRSTPPAGPGVTLLLRSPGPGAARSLPPPTGFPLAAPAVPASGASTAGGAPTTGAASATGEASIAGPSAKGGSRWLPLDIPPDISPLGLHVGTGGYEFRDWAGRFFPPGAPGAEWFAFYQLYFSFLEINHTFSQEPRVRDFVQLERRSKPGLMFSVKVHGDISNKRIWDPEAGRSLMRKHAAAVGPLAEAGRFYSFLIQLDEGVERGRKVLDYLLETASAAVSEGLDVHVEFRNRTWHQEAVLQSLKDAGVGICNTDIPGLPLAFPLKAYATTGKAYVRYCGLNAAGWSAPAGGPPAERLRVRNARYDYRYSLEELEERVHGQLLLLKKTGSVAAVFRNHVGAMAALNAVQDIHLLLRNLR